MKACLWSLCFDSQGLSVCAFALNADYRCHFIAWPRQAFEPISVEVFWQSCLEGLRHLAAWRTETGEALALVLASEDQGPALFIDGQAKASSPLYWDGQLPPVPQHAVPDIFASNEGLQATYRQSPLRRLRQSEVDFGLAKPLGLATPAALLLRALCGQLVDVCLPFGTASDFPNFQSETLRALGFQALGLDPTLSMQRARVASFVGEIRDTAYFQDEAWQHWIDEHRALPVFHAGSSDACLAYACAANPLSWAATLGWESQALWIASATALAEREISIHPEGLDRGESEPFDDSVDAWTLRWGLAWEGLAVHIGPRRALAAYGLPRLDYSSRVAQEAFERLHQSTELFGQSPVGSQGLHLIESPLGLNLLGLSAYHSDGDILRAHFEAQLYRLRAHRESLELQGLGPLRLCINPPWPLETAELAADILAAPVLLIDAASSSLAALGAALAIARELQLFDESSKVSLPAISLEPSARSQAYEAHYHNHLLLAQGLR